MISWLRRLRNLELAFSVHNEDIENLKERVEAIEETRGGKSAIGFTVDDDEPLVVM